MPFVTQSAEVSSAEVSSAEASHRQKNPRTRLTHEQSRAVVCLVHHGVINLRKHRVYELSDPKGVIESNISRISSWSVRDDQFPKVICNPCKLLVGRLASGNQTSKPEKFLKFEDRLENLPPLPTTSKLRSFTKCDCEICNTANDNERSPTKKLKSSQKNSSAVSSTSSSSGTSQATPTELLSQSSSHTTPSGTSLTSTSQASSSSSSSILYGTESQFNSINMSPASKRHPANAQLRDQKVCGACLQTLARGHNHPCDAAARKENIDKRLTQKEKHVIASELLREETKDSGKITLHTPGRPATLYVSKDEPEEVQYTHEQITDLMDEVGANSDLARENFCKRMRRIHSTPLFILSCGVQLQPPHKYNVMCVYCVM